MTLHSEDLADVITLRVLRWEGGYPGLSWVILGMNAITSVLIKERQRGLDTEEGLAL